MNPAGGFSPASRGGGARGFAAFLAVGLAACASHPSSSSYSSPPPSAPPPLSSSLTPWQRIDRLGNRLGECSNSGEYARLANELGRAYLEVERPERARHFFYRSLQRDEAGSLVASNERGIGEAFLREGNAPSAERSLARAVLRARPGTEADEARLLHAICLERLGRAKEAADLRRSIASPDRATLQQLEKELVAIPAPSIVPAPAAGKVAAPTGRTLKVVPRASWGPSPMGRDVEPMGTPKRITIHHSATSFAGTSERETATEIRTIQRIHQDKSGWADIGYHYVVDRTGRIWEGRPLSVQGAHAGNRDANRGNIGICLLGNFEEEPISPRQAEGLRAILGECMTRFRIAANRVYSHREIRADYGLRTTECPGRTLQAYLDRFRKGDAPSGKILARGR
ncbi:MAG: peptidoglycan recognition protein family protein [Planctomycetes bacterium]|nr:peptidoglycan recognition protein family protein [Planctomycetota bacterium]